MGERNIDIEIEQEGPIELVTVCGALDSSNLRYFKNELDPLFEETKKHVLLDCSDLTYASSQAFGLLSCYNKASKANGCVLGLCCLSTQIRNILNILGLAPIFRIYPSREQALAEMTQIIKKG